MEYIVAFPFHDRAQNKKLMPMGATYPPDGVDISDEWLDHLLQYRIDGKPILKEKEEPRRAGRPRKTDGPIEDTEDR